MAYNHLRDKVKSFLQPFAESGTPVGAEDIKAYFEKLRGDDQAIKAAGGGAAVVAGRSTDDGDGGGSGSGSGSGAEGNGRTEQSGEFSYLFPLGIILGGLGVDRLTDHSAVLLGY